MTEPLLDMKAVERLVRQRAEGLGAREESLPSFGRSRDFGCPHIEIDDHYHWVTVERGRELERRTTTDLDTLLYWIFSAITWDLASIYEVEHRRSGFDTRRLLFAKHVELLDGLDIAWGSRKRRELATVLADHPFVDPQHAMPGLSSVEESSDPVEIRYRRSILLFWLIFLAVMLCGAVGLLFGWDEPQIRPSHSLEDHLFALLPQTGRQALYALSGALFAYGALSITRRLFGDGIAVRATSKGIDIALLLRQHRFVAWHDFAGTGIIGGAYGEYLFVRERVTPDRPPRSFRQWRLPMNFLAGGRIGARSWISEAERLRQSMTDPVKEPEATAPRSANPSGAHKPLFDTARPHPLAAWRQALLILAGAAILIAGLSYASVKFSTVRETKLTPPPTFPRPGG